jgi:hypothetical protein
MKLANLTYTNSHYSIQGPTELLIAIQLATSKEPKTPIDHLHLDAKIYNVIKDWYVVCGVTGEQVCLADLHYWDVIDQIPFKDVETALSYAVQELYRTPKDERDDEGSGKDPEVR